MSNESTPMEMLIDVSSGETVVRPIDPMVVESMLLDAEREAAAKIEAENSKIVVEEKLAALGLTVEDLKAIML